MRKIIIGIMILALVAMIIHGILTIGLWLTLLVFSICSVVPSLFAYCLHLIFSIDNENDETYESY